MLSSWYQAMKIALSGTASLQSFILKINDRASFSVFSPFFETLDFKFYKFYMQRKSIGVIPENNYTQKAERTCI